MKIKSADFLASAPNLASCPPTHLPEFAFIGRSNVGKSSLINLLSGKKNLARISGTPGKTVLLNYFKFNDAWLLVDLPGYGYAKVAKAERAEFNEAVNEYIEQRDNLACLFVLIDSRISPQAIDLEFLEWVEKLDLNYALVFTKIDKQSSNQTDQAIAAFTTALSQRHIQPPAIFSTSVETKAGRSEILGAIERMRTEDTKG